MLVLQGDILLGRTYGVGVPKDYYQDVDEGSDVG